MKTREITRVAMYTALICSAAVIFRYVPQTVVPYSILPLLVLLAGFVLGPKLGAWSMTIYVLLGLVGVPVYATAPFGGPAYLLKPTFGFLLGYILAAYLVGKIMARKKNAGVVWSCFAVTVGIAAIYVLGLSYFFVIMNLVLHQVTSVWAAIKLAFLPFILFDLIKGFGAVVLGRILRKTIMPLGDTR